MKGFFKNFLTSLLGISVILSIVFLSSLITLYDYDRLSAQTQRRALVAPVIGWQLTDTFENYSFSSIDGNNGWVSDGAFVTSDPTGNSNRVLAISSVDTYARKLFPSNGDGGLGVPDNFTGTIFYRIYRDGLVDSFGGGSDSTNPTEFGNYEVQVGGNVAAVGGIFTINNSGQNLNGVTFQDREWHCVWIVVDHSLDEYFVYVEGGAWPNQINIFPIVNGVELQRFGFRNGSTTTDMRNFFVKSSNTHNGITYYDDVYIDPGQENLTVPNGSCSNDASTPTPTETPTPSRTPTPTGGQAPIPIGTEVLTNGTFDGAPLGAGWIQSSSQGFSLIDAFASSFTFLPHSEPNFVWLGGADNEISTVSQFASVPSAQATTLIYRYQIISTDNCGFDFGRVLVNNTIVKSFDLCGSTATSAWVTDQINLDQFRGQDINLVFDTRTNASIVSSLVIDSASLIVSNLDPTPTFTPSATPSPTRTSTPTGTPRPIPNERVFLPYMAILSSPTPIQGPFLPPTETPTPTPCVMSESEPNNKRADADQITSCQNVLILADFGSNESEFEGNYLDIYAYTHSGGLLELRLTNVPVGSDYNLILVDTNNEEIASSVNPANQNDQILLGSLPAGGYFITVENLNAVPSTQVYQLRVDR